MLVWANEALVLWLLVRLLAPAPITIPAAITIYLLSGTAGMASSLPGGIGVNEAATVLLLGQQGVPAAVALPVRSSAAADHALVDGGPGRWHERPSVSMLVTPGRRNYRP